MRIGGKSDFARRVPFTFVTTDDQEITITARTLPFGAERPFEAVIPKATPPTRWLPNPETGKRQPVEDTHDAAYQRADAEATLLRFASLFWLAVHDDPLVEFEAGDPPLEEPEALLEWVRRIAKEIAAAGITLPMMVHLLKETGAAASKEYGELEANAREVFTEGATPQAPTNDTSYSPRASGGESDQASTRGSIDPSNSSLPAGKLSNDSKTDGETNNSPRRREGVAFEGLGIPTPDETY